MSNPRQFPSIRESYCYTMMNKGGAMDNLLKQFLTKSVAISPTQVEDQISNIRRYFKYPLVNDVLHAFLNNDHVYARMFPAGIAVSNRIPVSLPYFLTGRPNDLSGVCILDNIANYDEDGNVNIDPKKLYVLLESTYLAKQIQQNPRKLDNTIVYVEAASIYAHMLTRVLNKLYALNVDKSAFAKVIYLCAKYFFLTILRKEDSDMVQNYCLKISGLNMIAIKDIDEAFRTEDYASIATFLTRMQEMSYLLTTGMKNLTVRNYINAFLTMYGNSALFTLESFSYFLFNIISAVNGGFLNNQYAFDDIIGKSGDKFYSWVSNAYKK